MKFGRKNSDDGVPNPIQSDARAQGIWIAGETIFPQAIADHDYRRAVVPVFLRRELAAESWLYAQCAEESRGDLVAIHVFRPPRTGQIGSEISHGSHFLE